MSRPILTITDDGKVALTVSQESLTDEETSKLVAFGEDYRRVLEQERLRDMERAMKRAEQRAIQEQERRRKPWLR